MRGVCVSLVGKYPRIVFAHTNLSSLGRRHPRRGDVSTLSAFGGQFNTSIIITVLKNSATILVERHIYTVVVTRTVLVTFMAILIINK